MSDLAHVHHVAAHELTIFVCDRNGMHRDAVLADNHCKFGLRRWRTHFNCAGLPRDSCCQDFLSQRLLLMLMVIMVMMMMLLMMMMMMIMMMLVMMLPMAPIETLAPVARNALAKQVREQCR